MRVKKTRPILMAPTGFGKTLLAAKIIESARAKGNRVWFLVPAISLVDQSVRAFWDEGLRDIGVLQASHAMTDYGAPIQVVSPLTLEKRNLDEIERPNIVIVDECHRSYEIVKRLIEEWPEVVFIGLSATPWSKGLGRFWNNLIVSATTADLIRLGVLSPFKVYAPSHPDTSKVKITTTANGRDFAEGELSEVMQDATLTADIVATWLQRGKGRPTLCFGVDRAHALSLHQQFERAGVRSAYQDSQTPDHERENIRKGFASGEIEIVCNIATLTTGVDWDVRCIVLARPTRSPILYTQIVGRGLRNAPGKDHLLLLDHSNSTLELGFVTDIGFTSLDDGAPAKASEKRPAKAPRECASCGVLMPKFARVCPDCKFEAAPQGRDVETVDGDLVELDGKRKGKAPSAAEKRQFYAELLGAGEQRGKTVGWALANFRERYSEWPHGKSSIAACDPSPATLSWLKSRAIRYAKRMEKERSAVA
jgi:superfamily II DNA or RNA helicase